MQLVQSVRFNGTSDSHIVNRFSQLETLTGIAHRDDDDLERKAFRRIRGNSATVNDLKRALRAALACAEQLARDAETDICPFPEIPGRTPSIEHDWREGLRSVPPRIRSMVENLADLIEDEIGIRIIAE